MSEVETAGLLESERALYRAERLVLRTEANHRKVTPVIDRRFALSDVPDALRYQGERHPRGKFVIVL